MNVWNKRALIGLICIAILMCCVLAFGAYAKSSQEEKQETGEKVYAGFACLGVDNIGACLQHAFIVSSKDGTTIHIPNKVDKNAEQ